MRDYLCPKCGNKAFDHEEDGFWENGKRICNRTEASVLDSVLSNYEQALSEAREALEPFAEVGNHLLKNHGESIPFVYTSQSKVKDVVRAFQWLQKWG